VGVIEDEIVQKRREPYTPSLLQHALPDLGVTDLVAGTIKQRQMT
jgi:hypothetical protein